MKVVLVNTSDRRGGAAVACMRLAKALRDAGIDVSVLVLDKSSSLPYVTSVQTSWFARIKAKYAFVRERLDIFLHNGFSRKDLFAVSTALTGFDISNHPLVKEADIVHLHWINQGFLSLKGLEHLLSSGKPVVWTLHDMWAATGICHYPHTCDRFKSFCGRCPFLHSESITDLSAGLLTRKEHLLAGVGLQFVSCSHWLEQEARQSISAAGNAFTSIPNPIDTNLFCPGNQLEARKKLQLPNDKKLILFGAAIASDTRKGMDYLAQATHLLKERTDIELVMFGQIKGKKTEMIDFGLPVHRLGYIQDVATLVEMYQAVDVLVVPSLEDNLPNQIMEAMACGTPCVGFAVGGIPEMIMHCSTGYVAKYRSSQDLAEGIKAVIDTADRTFLRNRVREFAEKNYAESTVATQYIAVYDSFLRQRREEQLDKE